ncbi:TPA: hypothetical protein ACGOXQ_002113 [Streptococcus suis]
MNRERFFELLKSPCTPYVIVELIYVIAVIIFNINLAYINKLLNQNFDVDRMVVQKDVIIATKVMAFENNTSWNYLFWGIVLIVIGFVIPIVSNLINNSSYKSEGVKTAILMVICFMTALNIILIISISKALLSPIVIATLILCAAGALFAIGSSQS